MKQSSNSVAWLNYSTVHSSPPWSWCITASTITPPCQLLNSHTFFILTNRLNRLKQKAFSPAGSRAWPTNLEHHNLAYYFNVALADDSYISILPNPFFHGVQRWSRQFTVQRFLAFSSPVTLRTQQA